MEHSVQAGKVGFLHRERIALWAGFALVLQLAVLGLIVAVSHGWVIKHAPATTTDFVSFYAAGRLADAGTPALAYDHAAHRAAEEALAGAGINYQFFNYPPVYLLPFAALARLPYLVAFVLFEVATLAFYLVVGLRILGERGLAAILGLLAVPVAFWNFGIGQNAFLTAGLLGTAMLAVERRPVVAGVLLGALCYKPQFGLLLPLALIAGGEWRAFAAAAATVAGLVLLSLGVFGVATWQAFLATAGAAHATYESGRIIFGGMANAFGGARLVGIGVPLAYALQAAVSVAVAGIVAVVWRRRLSLPTRAAVLASAMVVASPLALIYDLMLAAVAGLWLIRDRQSTFAANWEKAALAALFILSGGTPQLAQKLNVPIYPLVGLAMFALACGRARREAALQSAAHRDRSQSSAKLRSCAISTSETAQNAMPPVRQCTTL
jgi:hypothetical protein